MRWLRIGATSAPDHAPVRLVRLWNLHHRNRGLAQPRVLIEYRTTYYDQSINLNYEIALFENGSPPFKYIYNTINAAGIANDSELVIGVKKDDTIFSQYGCDPTGGQVPPVASGQALSGSLAPCASPTPTPTSTTPQQLRPQPPLHLPQRLHLLPQRRRHPPSHLPRLHGDSYCDSYGHADTYTDAYTPHQHLRHLRGVAL